MTTLGGHELRAHPRISAPMRAHVHPRGGRPFEVPVRDVSEGGLFLLTSTPLCEVGEVIEVELAPPDGGSSFVVPAEAVRSVLSPEGGQELLGMGFQFTGLRPEQQRMVRAFVAKLLEGSGGERRAYPRVSHRAAVQCTGERQVGAVLRDLSLGGARLFVEAPLAVGERVVLELGAERGGPLRLLGEVVSTFWARPDEPYDQAGIQFIDLTEDTRQQLQRYLGRLLGL